MVILTVAQSKKFMVKQWVLHIIKCLQKYLLQHNILIFLKTVEVNYDSILANSWRGREYVNMYKYSRKVSLR
jgi:hypothetical protein